MQTAGIDESLYERARAVADPDMTETDILREALMLFVRIQLARRLATTGVANVGMHYRHEGGGAI